MKANNHLISMREYKLFPMGQTIINTDDADNMIYVLVGGEVAIQMDKALIDIIKPGEFLTARMLPKAPGIVAVAKTNCRLDAVNK